MTQGRAVSVRQRLLNLARSRGEDFQLLVTRYGIERFLYRLGRSIHADRFVLKGAMLFHVWGAEEHRPTRDLDLLGFGSFEIDQVREMIDEVLAAPVDEDGLRFDRGTLVVSPIREDDVYGGIRAEVRYDLAGMQMRLQIDVGIGDSLVPQAERAEFPTLLDDEAPRLRVYRRETVVAEKLHAMVVLGLGNSRMKDFYDIAYLAEHFDFDGQSLVDAIVATFKRRRTPMPKEHPLALTDAFAGDEVKQTQWMAFLRRSRLPEENLASVVDKISTFLEEPLVSAGEGTSYRRQWQAGSSWIDRDQGGGVEA